MVTEMAFWRFHLDFFSSHLACVQEVLIFFKLEKNSIVKSEL